MASLASGQRGKDTGASREVGKVSAMDRPDRQERHKYSTVRSLSMVRCFVASPGR